MKEAHKAKNQMEGRKVSDAKEGCTQRRSPLYFEGYEEVKRQINRARRDQVEHIPFTSKRDKIRSPRALPVSVQRPQQVMPKAENFTSDFWQLFFHLEKQAERLRINSFKCRFS